MNSEMATVDEGKAGRVAAWNIVRCGVERRAERVALDHLNRFYN